MRIWIFTLLCGISLSLSWAEETPKVKPALTFESVFHDAGTLTSGLPIETRFRFKNTSDEAITIEAITPSCGCTSATAEKSTYAPGEEGTLQVNIDTRDKNGITYKTIDVRIKDQPAIELAIMARLERSPHPAKQAHVPITIDPKCRSCHLDAGKGKQGALLYSAICAMCHGDQGEGKSAAGFLTADWSSERARAKHRAILQHGLPGTGMPPYVEGVTPPLTDAQIQSLVEYVAAMGTPKPAH